jgi:ABC-2 type transport system permease protein
MKSAPSDVPASLEHPPLHRGPDLTALGALAILTLRQNLHGRRLLVLSLLFLLPSVFALITRLANFPPPPGDLEFAFVFNLIPHALVTLTALLYAAGCIQDEVEEQTLTYLLVRPLPRWLLYLTKLLVTWLMTSVLTGVFTTLAYLVIYWGTPELWGDVIPVHAGKTAALLALMLAGYCSGFGAISMYTRRALLAGLIYIVTFEGLLASVDFVGRKLTVMYYFRVLAMRWLEPSGAPQWSIDLDLAPTSGECLLTLVGMSTALALLGAVRMMQREHRMKTPEGS